MRNVSCAIALIQSLSLAPVALGQPGPGLAAGSVSGYIWNAANSPVAKMVVVLRNVGTGQVGGTMTSDENGHVGFHVKHAGTYVLEVVEGRGSVIATGQTFGIEPGESVVTFVRLPARSPWYAGLFNNAGVVAVATAAGIGVTAVGTTGQPQSPGR